MSVVSYGFYTVTSFKEASGDIGFPFFAAFACVASFCFFFFGLFYLSWVFMRLRPRGGVRIRRPEMMD